MAMPFPLSRPALFESPTMRYDRRSRPRPQTAGRKRAARKPGWQSPSRSSPQAPRAAPLAGMTPERRRQHPSRRPGRIYRPRLRCSRNRRRMRPSLSSQRQMFECSKRHFQRCTEICTKHTIRSARRQCASAAHLLPTARFDMVATMDETGMRPGMRPMSR